MGSTAYYHRFMPESPKGREIERLEGDGARSSPRLGDREPG